MSEVRALLVGAGWRGRFNYAGYAQRRPERLRIVALAEPDPGRRQRTAADLGLAKEAVFSDWPALLAGPPESSLVIVATGDTQHVEPTLAALESGYHVLLEKPIAPTPAECVRVVEAAERAERVLQICHPLRFTPFYTRVREIATSGRLGKLMTIDMKEHIAYWHMTHSYVRGKFRKREIAAPIILAKSCHDLDLLTWIAGTPAQRVSSFGSLGNYRAEQAPPGAPERCTSGCPVQDTCPHDAVRFYADADPRVATLWPWSDVSPDPSRAARLHALETGRYGRCVYHCDNDVPDRQVSLIEFAGGLTATFTLHGCASRETRTIRITGSEGELRGVLQDGIIEVSRHGEFEVEKIEIPGSALGHHGGDEGLLDHLTSVLACESQSEMLASGRIALESHLIGFAIERARESASVIALSATR